MSLKVPEGESFGRGPGMYPSPLKSPTGNFQIESVEVSGRPISSPEMPIPGHYISAGITLDEGGHVLPDVTIPENGPITPQSHRHRHSRPDGGCCRRCRRP